MTDPRSDGVADVPSRSTDGGEELDLRPERGSRWLKWGVSLALIAVLVWFVDVDNVYRVLANADPRLLIVAVGVMIFDRLLMAGKWVPLLWIQVPAIPVSRAVRAYFAASFASLFLPASVGADALRSYGLGSERGLVAEVGASVVLERMLGVVGSGIVALAALWVGINSGVSMEFLLPWILACAGAGLAAVIMPFSLRLRGIVKNMLDRFGGNNWESIIERLGRAYAVYRRHLSTVVIVGVLSTLEQLVPVLTYWIVAHALQLGLSPTSLFVAVPLSMFAARIPVGVAGIGILEGGLIYLLSLFGVSAAEAFSLSVAGRFVEFVAVFPGAVWWRQLTGKYERAEALQ